MKSSRAFVFGFALLLLPVCAAAQPVPVAPAVSGVSPAAPAAPEVKSGGGDKACPKDRRAGLSQACKDRPAGKKERHRDQNKGKGEDKKAGALSSGNKAAPELVLKGGAAFKDSGKGAFYGVGSAPSTISDEYLRRETADNRARADIQNIFSTSMESTGTTTHTADGGEKVAHTTTTFKSGTISMAQIIDHYQAADGTLYSLAKIDIDR